MAKSCICLSNMGAASLTVTGRGQVANVTEALNSEVHCNLDFNNHTWLEATIMDSKGLRDGSHSSSLQSSQRHVHGAPETQAPRVPLRSPHPQQPLPHLSHLQLLLLHLAGLVMVS